MLRVAQKNTGQEDHMQDQMLEAENTRILKINSLGQHVRETTLALQAQRLSKEKNTFIWKNKVKVWVEVFVIRKEFQS